jgi:beta-lactamase regulating signal transducer with metallopeptidase domain/lipopolysaccharide export system protein LptA
MSTYIIKSALSLAVLYGVYELLFSRIKTFRLNRFLLLAFILSSLVLPLFNIHFDFASKKPTESIPLLLNTLDSQKTINEKLAFIIHISAPSDEAFIMESLLALIYAAVLFILLYRFVKNIHAVKVRSVTGARAVISGHKIVLLEDNVSPYSFLRTIFIGRKDYESGAISESLIKHEIAHIRQLHSADIIFVEIISAFFWFNPFLYLYKRAIKLNHEYLADSYVLENGDSAAGYSDMLLNYSSRGKYTGLISGINYSFIKRRINMIIRNKNLANLKLRLFTAILIFAGLFLITACTFDITDNRTPDPIITMNTRNTSIYRVNDTIMYYYGDFTIQSGTAKTIIKAHRLKVSNGLSPNKNYFENDFMNGKVYNDGVDISTNKMFLDRIISYKADNIEKKDEQGIIKLTGNAEVKGEDVIITSEQITLYLSQWKKF